MALFDSVKTALRISGSQLDDDIEIAIGAAQADLSSAGVDVISHLEEEPIIVAIILYCRWYFNQLGDSDKWQKNYEFKKNLLSLDSNFNGYEEDEE